jgi:hypothetical protein
MRKARALQSLCAVLASGVAAAAPHEHGVGTLDVAVDAATLIVELRLPAQDVVGFERAPRTDAERARIEQVRAALADATRFTPNAEARCRATGAPSVEVPVFGPKAGDEHADFTATYRFECASTVALTRVDHSVFTAFPKVRRLQAQVISAKGQKQATLTPARPRLAL